MMQLASGEEVWRQFRNGSEEALAILYKSHYKALFAYGRKFCADRNFVEDCIHDLFLELSHNRQRLGDTPSVRHYLLKSLRRKIIHGLKKQNASFLPEEYTFELIPSHEQDLIGEENFARNRERILQAVAQLSQRQQEALYLKFYNDLDYGQIATVMSLNYQSARNLIHRAMTTLRSMIRDGALLACLLAALASLQVLFPG
jgi:RNA polymerase sigma factor (sigma-70 family)